MKRLPATSRRLSPSRPARRCCCWACSSWVSPRKHWWIDASLLHHRHLEVRGGGGLTGGGASRLDDDGQPVVAKIRVGGRAERELDFVRAFGDRLGGRGHVRRQTHYRERDLIGKLLAALDADR